MGVKGETVVRPYNPVSLPDEPGKFALAVKKYPDSKMGNYVHNLKAGDTVMVRGPNQQWKYTKGDYKHIGMVAGGTGVTPLLQTIGAILDDQTDDTKITLVFCNKTYNDIILKKQIHDLEAGS